MGPQGCGIVDRSGRRLQPVNNGFVDADPRQIERRFGPVGVPGCVRDAERVLFFGGSFDPPHLGHATLPFEVAERLWPGQGAWVVFVPAARSPHKQAEPAPDADRVEMLRLALRGQRRWWVWEQELRDAALNPGSPSFWADTRQIARQVFNTRPFAFLIGVDQALAMHRWRRYREFWSEVVVMARGEEITPDGFGSLMAATGAWSPDEVDHWVARLVKTGVVEASSTGVRAALADPAKRNARVEGLDPGVHRYILDRGLYRSVDRPVTPSRGP